MAKTQKSDGQKRRQDKNGRVPRWERELPDLDHRTKDSPEVKLG